VSQSANSARPIGVVESTTIFASAFLLFEVEPLIAKAILPWFGGSAEVWTTCLLFFQAALLAGYLYAHVLSRRFRRSWQVSIHSILLLASLLFLPILPSAHWAPVGDSDPIFRILLLLAVTIGLPFTLLSATSPLVQSWLVTTLQPEVNRSPYRLFALSNLGSLLALLSYPILVEPNIPLRTQSFAWSIAFCAVVLLSIATGWRHRFDGARVSAQTTSEASAGPSFWIRTLWFGLAAMASGLLLAMTNYMLQNIASIPLFWVVPLALYLLSFVVAFNGLRWFRLPFWYGVLGIAIAAVIAGMNGLVQSHGVAVLPFYAVVLFVICLVCHGEVAVLRPSPSHLTSYYLTIAAGGAAGGLFVAVVAPLAFNASYELYILIPTTLLLVLLAASRHYRGWADKTRRVSLGVSASVFFAAVGFAMVYVGYQKFAHTSLLARNFYGSLAIIDRNASPADSSRRLLVNGNIVHGIEYTSPGLQRVPLSYYSRASGIGLLLRELGRSAGPLQVGIIGLGVGTLAAYGREGDDYRFYEINPLVAELARKHFWYLSLTPARVQIVLGDGRLSLEKERDRIFDVLVVDAFISDAIPLHLLTREAFALYWRKLKTDGVLAVHVSNPYADLAPVVANAALEAKKTAWLLHDSGGRYSSDWVLVGGGQLESATFAGKKAIPIPAHLGVWTDDFSNLWSVLRFREASSSICLQCTR